MAGFDRYTIVDTNDLQLAAQRRQAYLEALMGTVTGTVADFENEKGVAESANPLSSLEPPCGIEPQTYALRVRCSTS